MAKETPGLTKEQAQAESPVLQILNFLSSMQLGIILLLLLAVISVFATLREYETAVQTIYRSPWFIGIMSFSALNLLLCSVRRIGPLSRMALQPVKVQPSDTIRRMPANSSVKLSAQTSHEKAVEMAAKAFGAAGLKVSVEEGSEGKVVFGEKGRLGYFGSAISHFGLLIILLGAMFGSLTGYETRNGGIAGDKFLVPEGNFTVNITDVNMEQEQDPTIRPRVYSDVIITKAGEEVARGTVAINQPLRFDGNTIYHTTFRYVSDVVIKDASGTETTQQLLDQDQLSLDNQGKNVVHFMQFFPNFTMDDEGRPYTKNYLPERPVLAGILVENGQPQKNVFLQVDVPHVIETADGELELTLKSYQNAAVYSITRNLGRPYLFAGSVLLVLGLYMSFFLFPRRFWAVYDEKKAALLVGGRSYKNRLGIDQDMDRITSLITSREGE